MRRRFINSHKTFDYSKYMTIEALEDGYEVYLTRDIEYNLNGHKWESLKANFNSPILKKGDLLSFRCSLIPGDRFGYFFGNGKAINLRGNILSLIFKDDINLDISGYRNVFSEIFAFYIGNNIISVEKNFLPATILGENCYYSMFQGCKNLVKAPSLPATTLADGCYNSMFYGCTSLTTAPELPATTLAGRCYGYMFNNCSNLSYITMLATYISVDNCLTDWVSGVASSGIFVKHANMTSLPSGNSGIPDGWTVEDNMTLLDCFSLEITADNALGKDTKTTIYYTAQINALDKNGNTTTVTRTGTAISESFPQNTSMTDTIERIISFTFMGITATTTIIQGMWSAYTVNLNNQWQLSDKPNPNSTLYDGVYESFSNTNKNNVAATMYIDIEGYYEFTIYIRSHAESNYDYIMVSQLDQSIYNSTLYNNTTLVKAHTRGNQKYGTDISNYTPVQFTNIDGGKHRITIVYRKDASTAIGADKGYILIATN